MNETRTALGESCTIESRRACDMKVAASMVEGLAEESGVPCQEVSALMGRSFASDEEMLHEVVSALCQVVARLPEGEARRDGVVAIIFAANGNDGG